MYHIKSMITTTVIVVTIISRPSDIKLVIITMFNEFSDYNNSIVTVCVL